MKKSIISISLLMFSGSLIFARDFRPDILETYENNMNSVQAQQTLESSNSSSSSKYETVSLSLDNSNTNNSIQNGTTNNSYSNLPNVKGRSSYDRLSNLPKLTSRSYFKDYSDPGLRIGFFVTDTFLYNLSSNGHYSEKTIMGDDYMYLGKVAYELGGGYEVGIKGGNGCFYGNNVWDLMFTFMYSQNLTKISKNTYCGIETGVSIGMISAMNRNWYDYALAADCSLGMFFDISDFRLSFDIVYSYADFTEEMTGRKLEGQLAWNAGISYKF